MAAMQYAKPGGVFDEYRASRITPEQLRAIMRSKHQYSVVNTYMGNADNLELKWAEEGGKMV